jgi:hypothetical protein
MISSNRLQIDFSVEPYFYLMTSLPAVVLHRYEINCTNYILMSQKQQLMCSLLPVDIFFMVERYLEGSSFLISPLKHKFLPYEVKHEAYTYNLLYLTLSFPQGRTESLLESFMKNVMAKGCSSWPRKRQQRLLYH